MFPITVGGEFDEFVNCTMHDKVNDIIIVAGYTESDEFAPTESAHGWAYAVDFDGNWLWGYFYYNVGAAIESIAGCHFDANNDILFHGLSGGSPYILRTNPLNSNPTLSFVEIKAIEDEDEEPKPSYEFKATGAFYHDLNDPIDGLQYYYMSFLMDNSVYIAKIRTEDMKVVKSVRKAYKGDLDNKL
jgi:hypothetical protein